MADRIRVAAQIFIIFGAAPLLAWDLGVGVISLAFVFAVPALILFLMICDGFLSTVYKEYKRVRNDQHRRKYST